MDLDNIAPYKYVINDFNDKGDLPEVEKEVPERSIFEPGGITLSAGTMELVEDILTAVLRDNLKVENERVLKNFTDLRNPALMDARLREINVRDVDNILDTTIPLEKLFTDLFFHVEENSALAAYLPTYVPPKIDGIIFNFYDIPPRPDARLSLGTSDHLKEFKFNSVYSANPTLVTPCSDAIEVVYQETLNLLVSQSEEQILQSQEFYEGIREDILNIKSERFAYLTDTLQGSVDELRRLGIAVNIASNELLAEGKITEEIYYGVKVFLVAFLVKSRQNLIMMEDTITAAIDTIYQIDIGRTDQAYNNFIEKLIAVFDEVIKDLNSTKIGALNNCHNQGGGS
ncbi:hypothetical protein P872_09500 [Rhodonellum psychrophilum GCM71 = DSM 17998]|uniref:Uncharacterized protein n=2 Tax=Rhodonellum TaxID=336827 RepID=U5BLK3_9BACT|nr:hypothetical protein P872_09500 [Rhodonellum psychrophilum GCM71 = DSM 17998]